MQIAGTCLARTRYYIDIKTNRQPVTLRNAIGVMRIVGACFLYRITRSDFSQGRCQCDLIREVFCHSLFLIVCISFGSTRLMDDA